MANNEPLTGKRILFVTGRLAQHALENELKILASEVDIDYEVAVLPITVAALMTPTWIAKKLEVPRGIDNNSSEDRSRHHPRVLPRRPVTTNSHTALPNRSGASRFT